MRAAIFASSLFLAGSALVSAPMAGPIGSPCYLTVYVPVGATLTVNGVRTAQMTAIRSFVSPELPLGETYFYTFAATYTQDGVEVSKTKPVPVRAGEAIVVDFADVAAVKVAAKGGAVASPFEVPKSSEEKPKDDKKPEIEVPYVPTPAPVVAEMLKLANVKPTDVVYDLGSGDGRIAIAAVKDFKAKKGLGIDYNPERIKESEAAAKAAGVLKSVEFRQGDVLKLTAKDFDGVDVVTLYLLPSVNEKLKPILLKGLKPGARVVSHNFGFGLDWKPDQTSTVTDADGIDHSVYLWTIR